MGGLGNGRRGGRSPPLLIAALVASFLVLGFNYWVSSSRNLELQTRLYELEGQMRREAAERGSVEMKNNRYEEELKRQREQINNMGKLQSNISSSAKTIQELKGQLHQMNNDLGKLQMELQSCQGNIKTLNSKLTYDMTQCNSQILSQKQLCDERMAAAKLEYEKKVLKLAQEKAAALAAREEVPGTVKISTPASAMTNISKPHVKEAAETMTNEITVGKDEEHLKEDVKPVPTVTMVKKDLLAPLDGVVTTEKDGPMDSKHIQDNLTEDKDMELLDAHEEDAHSDKKNPGAEALPIGEEKADEDVAALKTEDQNEYDLEEQMQDADKQLNNKPDNLGIDLEQELADYNGDDDNEGEFEADKQAVLAQD